MSTLLSDARHAAVEGWAKSVACADPATMMLDRADMARELRCSTATVDRLDAVGSIPAAIHLGGGRTKRWLREELAAWARAGGPPREVWMVLREDAWP